MRQIAVHLDRQREKSVMLTYRQIEAIIDDALPLGATIGGSWWTTATLLHVRMWREFGWRAYPDPQRRAVRFIRDAEEPADDLR